jgi:hypothetical protein
MKKIFIFLTLIVFSFCHLDEAKIEEIKKRRKQEMKYIAECLLENPNTSEKLKISIKKSSEDDLIRAIYPPRDKLDKNDIDIIRVCRKQAYKSRNEDFRKKELIKNKEKNNNHDL